MAGRGAGAAGPAGPAPGVARSQPIAIPGGRGPRHAHLTLAGADEPLASSAPAPGTQPDQSMRRSKYSRRGSGGLAQGVGRNQAHLLGTSPRPDSPPPSSRRRAVSDAAQWIRQRRKSELQQELLPASMPGGRPHTFEWHTYSKPSFCAICSKVFWGFHRQGLKCTECGMDVHKQCQPLALSCLGNQGSIASLDQLMAGPNTLGVRLMRVCIASVEGLARKQLFRVPDPFAICILDNERFQTSVVRKTLNPEWNTARDMYISPSSTLTIYVFDSKKFREGEWHGFLGMAIVPASTFQDSSLGEGATNVFTFRLKKRRPDDVVTGRLAVRVKVLSGPVEFPDQAGAAAAQLREPRSPGAIGKSRLAPPTSPITVPGRDPQAPPDSELALLATSPGVGWQSLPKAIAGGPHDSLLPGVPSAPTVTLDDTDSTSVVVSWGERPGDDTSTATSSSSLASNPPATGINYTLGVITAKDEAPHDLYTGPDGRHTAVGFKPGQELQFMVKASNFFGSSDYSEPSPTISIPEETAAAAAEDDSRNHCPLFMAGFCFRGASCPMSHGSGLQTQEDVQAALMAVAYIADPDVQMAAAIAASLTEVNTVSFDSSTLPQYKRDLHRKETAFRKTVHTGKGECSFTVSRADIFKSSFFEVSRRKPADLRRRLNVQFLGEGGLDYGGLAREWFYLLSHELFHPSYGMFMYSCRDSYVLQINPNSAVNLDHLLYFQFVGRVIGLAILHHHFIDVSFSVAFYKAVLGIQATLSDMQEIDPDVHQSLIWTLENDIDDILELFFTVDYEELDEVVSHELIPHGSKVPVTNANKGDFVRLLVDFKLSRGTQRQMASLLHGLHEIVPRKELLQFTARELEYLLCGSREVDMEDWKLNTSYQGGFNDKSETVCWFWAVVERFDAEQQARFLQFCTGTSRVPIEGFQGLMGSDGPRKFCLQRMDDATRLPSAHTCFNRLDLPDYGSKERLKERLLTAMDNAQGFTGD